MVGESSLLSALPIPKDQSFIMQHGYSARWSYLVHAHPCYELIWISGGHGTALVGDHQGAFHPEDLFLLAPEVPHSFYSDGFLPDGQVLELRALYLMPSLVDSQFAIELSALSQLLSRARRGLHFKGILSAEIGGMLLSMKTASRLEGLGILYGILERLSQASDGVLLSAHETSARFRGEEMARLDSVHGILRKRYREPISLGEVAKEAGMSISTLNHLLRKYSRMTFLECLNSLRLDEARRMLRNTNQDITGIAFDAGFGSLATFNRRFRAADKLTPHEYRSQHQ
jgi:AraC-like DNA-binding protein